MSVTPRKSAACAAVRPRTITHNFFLTHAWAAALGLGFAGTALPAQQSAPAKRLNGVVHDPLGDVVVGASVDLLDETHVEASTSTGSDGHFHFDLSAAGRYRVRVSAATFEPTSTPASYFNGVGTSELDVTLATPTLTQEVTVTATGTPTPEAQSGESVTVLQDEEYQHMLEVQEALRLLPGLQVTQTGQMGGTTGLSIRGGDHDANRVLIDGIPANSIGGAVEFANLATVGIQSIEVLNEPGSVLYGADAMAGVVNLTTARAASTSLPLLTYAGDAGNFHTYRNEGTASTTYRQLDLYSTYARVQTSNNIPNSEFHNGTYAGNFGYTPNAANDLRFIVRHTDVSGGQPNAIALYGIPDDAQQKEQDLYLSGAWSNQATPRWHNLVRYGYVRLNGQYNDFAATGIYDPVNEVYDGAPVTITGANGYTASGQAVFQYSNGAPSYLEHNSDSSLYAQTDFRLTPHLVALGAFKYETESGSSGYIGTIAVPVSRGNYDYSLEFSGDLKNRLFYTVGTGLEKNGLYGFAGTPRASLAYYLFRPSSNGFFTGTKLHGTFGKGIKEPSVFEQTSSLYADAVATGISLTGLNPLEPEQSRTFDGGVDQQFANGRARVDITYFHDEFSHEIQNVPQNFLPEFGISQADLPNFPYGAYLSVGAFRSQGIEVSTEFRPMRSLFARVGYTYTDAVVQHSFASDAVFNTDSSFTNITIGAYAPLLGARPFRVAPHTGYFDLTYQHTKFNASLTGTLVSRRDDSTFLTDSNFGNSLLLPNRNLDGSFQRLALGGGYQMTQRLNLYANMENLLSEHYFEAFGFPALPLTFRTGMKLNFGGESWKLTR